MSPRSIRRVAGGALWLVLLATTPPVAEAALLPVDPAVVHGRLSNGLTYYLRENATPADRVELRLVVDIGSVHENDDQRGAAHLVEHLCFRGTPSFPESSLVSYLESLGAGFGPHVNALTTFDETIYRLSLPLSPDHPERLGTGLQILREWAGALRFGPAEVEAERGVVLAEWRERLGPGQRLLEQALPALYPSSRYIHRLPVADRGSIESVTVEALQAFYDTWYRPENFAIVVTGPIEVDSLRRRVEVLFGDLEARAPGPPPLVREATPPTETSATVVTDPEFGLHVVRIVFPHPRQRAGKEKAYRDALTRQLVGAALNERLVRRKERDPAVFQAASVDLRAAHVRPRNDLAVLALVSPGGISQGLRALSEEVERVVRFGFGADELDRAKANWLRAAEVRLAQRENRESAALADACIGHFLRGEPMMSPEKEYTLMEDTLGALDPAAFNAVARRLLDVPDLLVRLDAPASPPSPFPDASELVELVDVVRAGPLPEAEPDPIGPDRLLADLPEQRAISGREVVASLGVTELALPNGARVVLKPSRFREDEIQFSALRPGGLSGVPDELELAAKVAPGYVFEAGFGTLRKADLIRLLAGRHAALALRLDPTFDVMKGQCAEAELETLLQLVHLAFTAPRRDGEVFQSVLDMNRSSEAQVVMDRRLSFLDAVQERRFGGHSRTPRLLQPPEAWRDLTLEKILAAYEARFGGVEGFTFFIVGSFDPAVLETLVERYLGSLPRGPAASGAVDHGLRQVGGPLHEVLSSGADPKALMVVFGEEAAPAWELRDAHLLWSLGNILERALRDRLRLEEGTVYALAVEADFHRLPFPHARLEVSVPCAPDDVARSAAILREEVDRLRRQGPDPDELEAEIASQRADRTRELESNADWLWKLELIYRDEEGFGRLKEPFAMIEWLETASLQETAERYWKPDRWLRFDKLPRSPSEG